LPQNIAKYEVKISKNRLKKFYDMKKNINNLNGLCIHLISFKESKYNWKMILITNPKSPKGAFWFLPHDDENSAFTSAIYSTKKYGGGFLSVLSNGKRYFNHQDPNRNFGSSNQTAKTCKNQHQKAPLYTKIVFDIIDNYKKYNHPYLALHNNKNGHRGNGGSGGVSILKSSQKVQSYIAYPNITKNDRGLKDEDSLVYIAGLNNRPNQNKLSRLLSKGLNTKYEVITKSNNDCSMSNYVVLFKHSNNYYNVEAQKGDTNTQKKMIDRLMSLAY